jgi:hypothetical protein
MLSLLVRPLGFEPKTLCLEGIVGAFRCRIYKPFKRYIRTCQYLRRGAPYVQWLCRGIKLV